MASADTCGVILLGNSGVGKSFLANRLLDDDEAFESRFSARSVTRHTEWKDMRMTNRTRVYSVANIPGLVEANQELINENRNEIMKAFEQCPFAIVLFVFGHKNGRIPDEDLVAFMRINDAYEFSVKSLLLIVNGIPSDSPNDYEEKTAQLLQELTHVDKSHIYFIAKATSEESKQIIHQLLHEAIVKCEPTYHTKKRNIELLAEEISRLKMESKRRQEQLLAQEYEHSKRPKLASTRNPIQEYDQPPSPLSLSSPHHSPTTTIKPTNDSTNQYRQFQDLIEITPTKHEQYKARVEEQPHDAYSNTVTQLAQQLEDNSNRNAALIAQMPILPSVFIISEKQREKPVKRISKELGKVVNFIGALFYGDHSDDPHDPNTQLHDANEHNVRDHDNSRRNLQSSNPHSTKSDPRYPTDD